MGQSIVVKDKSAPPKPLTYMTLNDINSIELSGQILIIDDSSRGSIFLQFLTQYDTHQAHSLLNYVIENKNVNIDTLPPDDEAPIIYFYSNVGDDPSLDYIEFNGGTSSVPYDTSYGNTFSTTISLTQSGDDNSYLDKSKLIELLIDKVSDERDGDINMMPSDLVITTDTGDMIDVISEIGSYKLTFNLCDIAHNYVDAFVDLNIIT
jgi:hypothetical protein